MMIKNHCTARPHIHVQNEEMRSSDRSNRDVTQSIDVERLDGVRYRFYDDYYAGRKVQGSNLRGNRGNLLPFGLESNHKVSLPPF